MSVLVIAEHNNQQLKQSTLNTIAAAQQISDNVKVLLAGFACDKVAAELQKITAVTEILLADNAVYEHPLAETFAPLILEVIDNCSHVLAPATTFGKNIMPRVAACLGVAQISDIISVIDAQTYQRPIYAGNAIATVKSLDNIQVITVRTTAFAAAEVGEGDVTITKIDSVINNEFSKYLKSTLHGLDKPELASAKIVISGGRGLQNNETFNRLTAIADRIPISINKTKL